MRAMRLEQTRSPLLQVDLSEPVPGPGQVLIGVEACGVCRTDLHIRDGEVVAPLPRIPGHQVAGRILSLGTGVEVLKVGAPVGVGWLASSCGRCGFCRSGRENLCESARFTGKDVDGGYAERMVADAAYVFPLPPAVGLEEAAPLLCAGVIGYRSLELSGARSSHKLGLFGFGASAHLVLQMALRRGCQVYAFSRAELHRDLARKLGATWAGDTGDDPGVPLDAAITFAPAGEVVLQALRRLARGATLAINAIHMTPVPEILYPQIYGERVLRSVMNYTRSDAQALLGLATQEPFQVSREVFALDEANQALSAVASDRVRGAAVLQVGR